MAGIAFAPGEHQIASAKFSPTLLLFWLRTELGVSSMRLVWTKVNTLLGVIPLGRGEESTPLANTASVSVDVRFKAVRFFLGLGFLIWSFWLFGDAFFRPVLLLFIGACLVLSSLPATLTVRNNGGGTQEIEVSILEKAKLEEFANQVKQQLFADHARLRHGEHMNVQNAQLYVQQAQLNAHLAQNQQPPTGAAQPTHPAPQPPQPTTPPAPPAPQPPQQQAPATPPAPEPPQAPTA